MRTRLLALIMLVLLGAGLSGESAPVARPNIVVVMVDDLDYGIAGRLYQGGHLPSIKSAFGSGAIFTEAYVTTALCCPSRATFLTGQYTHNHGVRGNTLPNGGVTMLDDTSTIATWLQSAGYFVGHVGKYLNGYGSGGPGPLDPLYIPPGYDWWAGLAGNAVKMYGYTVNLNGQLQLHGAAPADYQTDVLAGLAVEFISAAESDDNRPFFLIVTPTAPHVEPDQSLPGCADPWRATIRPAPRHAGTLAGWAAPRLASFNEGNIDDKPAAVLALSGSMSATDIQCGDSLYRDRAESMLAVDDLVGAIVSALSAAGETDTAILFTSDNGYFHGEHRLTQKLFAYTEAIRVPLMIRLPGAERKVIEGIALNTDLAPSIADIAGVAPGHVVDGRSLLPLIDNPSGPWRDTFLVEYLGNLNSWPDMVRYQGVRTAQGAYTEWQDGAVEYYDLLLDPLQQRSLHTEPGYSLQMAQMSAALARLAACAGAECMVNEGP